MSFEKTKWVWQNNEFLPFDEAKIHSTAFGLHYGTGIFEGIRCYEGNIFRLKEHMDRFYASAEVYKLKIDYQGGGTQITYDAYAFAPLLTDFDLQRHPLLLHAWQNNQLVLTPNPAHYQRYADKRKLAQLSDADWLKNAGIAPAQIKVLLGGIPPTKIVDTADAEAWWTERKQWFFKPVSGYGSKGAYRGDKLTKRVFDEILQADYVAQRLAPPGECTLKLGDTGEMQTLKFDVRCYVYAGKIQLIAAPECISRVTA